MNPATMPGATLDYARGWLRERLDHGEKCPCCTQFAKVYRRKLTSSIARVLIAMHKKAGVGWVYLPDLRSRGQDEAIARYWGLIEAYPEERRDDGSTRVGWWRLTALGEAFVRNYVKVAKYARIYDNRCLGLDDEEQVSIVDALGVRFDYRELMEGR